MKSRFRAAAVSVLAIWIVVGQLFATQSPAGAQPSGLTQSCFPVGAPSKAVAIQALGPAGTVEAENGQSYLIAGLEWSNASQQALDALFRRAHSGIPASPTGPPDRYGRQALWLFDREGTPLQAHAIERGLAMVAPEPQALTGPCLKALYALERGARRARQGRWATPAFTPLSATDSQALFQALGRFRIVEGDIMTARDVRGRLYLNFGADWRTDFTASIAPADLKRWRDEAGYPWLADPSQLTGARVRIRGWLESYNGPSLVIDHPGALEIVARGAAATEDTQ